MEQVESDERSEDISDSDDNKLIKHHRRQKNYRGTKSSAELEAMETEALKQHILGNYEKASRLLKGIIQQAPDKPEPYFMLSSIHESVQEYDKAAEYLFMSTYLSPSSIEKWSKIADNSYELKMYNQAAYCYGRVLKIGNYDLKIMQKRALSFQFSSQFKKAALTYKKMLSLSASPEVVKQYARFRFRRGQYAVVRDILTTHPGYRTDPNMVNMICQTFLKQKKYAEASTTMKEYFEEEADFADLPIEFMKIVLLCGVVLSKGEAGRKKFSSQLQVLMRIYDPSNSEIYEQILSHLKDFKEAIAYEFLVMLLQHEKHRSIENYLFLTDYLKNKGDHEEACKYIQEALAKYPTSKALQMERGFIQQSIAKHQIYYSDQESDQFHLKDKLPPKQIKRLKTKAKQQSQEPLQDKGESDTLEDPVLIIKMLMNANSSMKNILLDSQPQKFVSQVEKYINFLASILPERKKTRVRAREDLYAKGTIPKESEPKNILSEQKTAFVAQFVNYLIDYLRILFSQKQISKIVSLALKIAKGHFLKYEAFKNQKILIYDITLFACLSAEKFKRAIYFLRFLICKSPQSNLYLLIMNRLKQKCPTSSFSKILNSKSCRQQDPFNFSLAIEYMENGCFQIAVSVFLKALGSSINRREVELCIASCLLQIGSSRNTFNKGQFTNRSALVMSQYAGDEKKRSPEQVYNVARWFAQVSLNHKAITHFQTLLAMDGVSEDLLERAAYCLVVIYQETEDYVAARKIKEKYFRCK